MPGITGIRREIPTGTFLHDAGFQIPVLAGNVFCTLTPAAGSYRIRVNRIAYGTGLPSLANNSRMFVGSDSYTLATGGILGVWYEYDFYLTLNGSTAVQLRAVANGSPNIGVACSLTAIKII